VHVNSIERVQRKFIRYALRGLGWMDMYDLPPYVGPCALNRLETLTRRRSDACVMFVFDVLSGRVGSSNLLSLLNVTRGGDFLRIDFHRTNYGVHEPLNDAVRHFNEVAGLFDFHLSSNQFFNRLKSGCCDLVQPFTLCWTILYGFPCSFRGTDRFFFVVSIYLRFELLILAFFAYMHRSA
jgi:hypothetical protein